MILEKVKQLSYSKLRRISISIDEPFDNWTDYVQLISRKGWKLSKSTNRNWLQLDKNELKNLYDLVLFELS